MSDPVEFDRFRMQFPLLTQWAGITGISISGSTLEGGTVSAGDTFDISYEFPESLIADLGEIELKLLINADFNIQRVGGASIDEETYFEVLPDSGKVSYEECIDYVGTLQDFITLATGKEVQASELIGRLDQGDGAGFEDVEIMFTTPGDLKVPEQLHPLKANFVLADIADEFSSIMETWFAQYDELEPVYNLYFGVQYNSEMYLQNQFLSLTQAIETYHRREIGGKYIPEEEFENFYQNLCDMIPSQFEESFKAHLKHGTFRYANEYSLRKRLSELVTNHKEILSNLPLEIESDVNRIVNTRNYLTHYDDGISPRADTSELHELVLKLSAILETVLLAEVGLPEEQISERLGRRYAERAV